jgi:hypothetical protein
MMAVDNPYYHEQNHQGIKGRERKIGQFPLGAQFTINRTDTMDAGFTPVLSWIQHVDHLITHI